MIIVVEVNRMAKLPRDTITHYEHDGKGNINITITDLIRCKDCKHRMPYDWMFSEVVQSKDIDDYPEDEIGCAYCDMSMGANDFCSRAERRGEQDEID